MLSYNTILFLLLLLINQISNNHVLAARILALLGTASPSHHIWNRSLMLALSGKGHHVTVVSPDPEKEPVPNHRDIVLEGIYEQLHGTYDYESLSKINSLEMMMIGFDWGSDICKFSLETQGAKQLLELSTKEKFDLIIVEAALSDCFLAYVPIFGNPPVVAITALSVAPWINSIVGNPDNPSYMPNFILPYASTMNFAERFVNFLHGTFTLLYRNCIHLPHLDKMIRQHFEDPIPPLSELEKNISLILVNSHFSLENPHPLVPALIQVGGMHVKPAKPLPKDIQTYLDEAKDGAIYFSLGSNLRSDKMNPETRQAFLDAFAELPQRILWKWESDSLPGQPKNVKVSKWLPQNGILAHPNTRLFITHSGQLSTQESFYHGVPVIGMPFFADQMINIEKLVTRGLGEKLDYNTITKDDILKTIHKVLDNPSYGERAKEQSKFFRDQIETPLERAVYWTEYVIRHKGAHHLRSAAVDLPLYQYLLLDVIAMLTAVITAVLLAVYLTVKKVLTVLLKSKKSKKPKQH